MDDSALEKVLLALWRQRQLSLDAVAGEAGLSLAEASAAIEQLARRCVLEHTPGAVELISSTPAIWRDILEYNSRQRALGRKVHVFQKTASTNDVCWNAAAQADAHGLVALADEQTTGRGRRGNAWQAKAGQSILMSVLLKDVPAGAETLTLVAGLAVALAIEAVTGIDCTIKWPNDIHIAGRKVAGILVEQRGRDVVIGIGVNVAQHSEDFPEELRGRATSVYIATGNRLDRLELIESIVAHLETQLNSPTDEWLTAWKSRCSMLGSEIEIRSQGKLLRGRVLDIDPLHGLALRDPTGATHWCAAQTSTISGA